MNPNLKHVICSVARLFVMDQWHRSTLASNSAVSGYHNQDKALQISAGSSRPPLSLVLGHQISHQLQPMLHLKSTFRAFTVGQWKSKTVDSTVLDHNL